MNKLINEQEQLKYAIKINGKVVSILFTSKMLAEQHLNNLPQEQQMIAEVVPVTKDGRQILFE